MPEPLEFDGIDRSNLEGSLLKLRKLGFVLEEFGRNFTDWKAVRTGWLQIRQQHTCVTHWKLLEKTGGASGILYQAGPGKTGKLWQ